MHMILFCLTVLQSAFPASWLLSLIPGIDWHRICRTISAFGVGWLIQSLPNCPCGIRGLSGCAEASLCLEKPAWSCWGAERWPDSLWCYPAEYCSSSSFLPAGLSDRAAVWLWGTLFFPEYFNFSYPAVRGNLSMSFFSSGHCPLQLPFCKSWFAMLTVEQGV